MKTLPTLNRKSFVVVLSMAAALSAASGAQADNPKPKPKPDTPVKTVTLNFTKLELTYRTDGSPGPSVNLGGNLHLVSEAFLSDSGVPVGFGLHGNLSDAFALVADNGASFVAVGASDGIPTECDPEACAPPFWTFTFRLIPQGAGLQPSLLFDLTVSTQYDTDGNLTAACVVGQEGCDSDEIVP